MEYVTQGTVQVKQRKIGDVDIVISPIPDYTVKHRDGEYTVLVGPPDATGVPTARIFPVTTAYKAGGALKDVLQSAAMGAIRVEVVVELKLKGAGAEVVAVHIPATPTKR